MDKSGFGEEEFKTILREVFTIPLSFEIDNETDLSEYIKDSIDLGEVLAVVKDRYDVAPLRTDQFALYSRFADVLALINNTHPDVYE